MRFSFGGQDRGRFQKSEQNQTMCPSVIKKIESSYFLFEMQSLSLTYDFVQGKLLLGIDRLHLINVRFVK